MNSPLRPEVEAAFNAALELSRAEQEIFLGGEYGHDPDVRGEVESLLRAYRAAGKFLEQGASESTASGMIFPAAISAALPPTIGRYRILRLLGEGGMGIVYEAVQEQPRRSAALQALTPASPITDILRRCARSCKSPARCQPPAKA